MIVIDDSTWHGMEKEKRVRKWINFAANLVVTNFNERAKKKIRNAQIFI
jgi:hypothetical protein